MMRAVAFIVRSIPVLALLAVAPDLAVAQPIVAGTWSTSECLMTLQQNGASVSGRYTNDNGEIVGTLVGNTLSGHWIEDSSAQRCGRPMNGRYYWGRIQYVFDGDRFSGHWSYCDSPISSSNNWTGQRQ